MRARELDGARQVDARLLDSGCREVDAVQCRLPQVGSGKRCVVEARPREVGAAEVRVRQVGLGEVGLTEADPLQLEAGELLAAEQDVGPVAAFDDEPGERRAGEARPDEPAKSDPACSDPLIWASVKSQPRNVHPVVRSPERSCPRKLSFSKTSFSSSASRSGLIAHLGEQPLEPGLGRVVDERHRCCDARVDCGDRVPHLQGDGPVGRMPLGA